MSPSRIVGVFTGCFGALPCSGSMKWTEKNIVIGQRSSFTIHSNGGGIVHVPMNAAGRALLARTHGAHFLTRVIVTSRDAGTARKFVTVVPFR